MYTLFKVLNIRGIEYAHKSEHSGQQQTATVGFLLQRNIVSASYFLHPFFIIIVKNSHIIRMLVGNTMHLIIRQLISVSRKENQILFHHDYK